MSRNIKLLVLGGLVVALAVIVIVFGKQLSTDPASASASPAASIAPLGDETELVPIAASDMTELVIEGDLSMSAMLTEVSVTTQIANDDGTYKQETTTENQWVSADFNADNTALQDMASSGGNMKSKRKIEENPADPSIYGLAAPVRTVTFKSADKSASIEIGDITPTNDAYYVRVKGETTVYTVSSYTVEMLLETRLNLISKKLYPTSGLAAKDVTALTFYRAGSELLTAKATSDDITWELSYPMAVKADYQDLQTVLTALASFTIDGFTAADGSDLATYGLDNPAYQFNYTLDGTQYVLKLGKTDENGALYACMDGIDGVFTVSADTFGFKDKPLIELIDTFVYMPTIYDTKRLVIKLDGRTDEFLFDVKKDSEDPEKITFNGRELTTDDEIKEAKGYFQGAIGMMGDTIDLAAKPSGTAEIILEYWLKDTAAGEKHVLVELIPTTDGYGYYAMKNGVYTGMIIGKRYLDNASLGIRPAYDTFKAVLDKAAQ